MKYEITKDQILQIVEWGNPRDAKMVCEVNDYQSKAECRLLSAELSFNQ